MPKHTTPKRLPAPATITPTARAVMLDRLADLELQHGHHATAEHLARQAASMREAAP